jgi:glycosyltransferase involved in cell wall biosynthesis
MLIQMEKGGVCVKGIKNKRYVITVSYGDYTLSAGGTDKFILSQQRMLNKNGISLIHIFPQLRVLKRQVHSGKVWGVMMDGAFCFLTDTYGIVSMIEKLQRKERNLLAFILHHLKDTSIKEVSRILRSTDAEIIMYLHDYYTICSESGLLRDYHDFCGITFPNDEKCKGCSCFDGETTGQIKRIKKLLKGLADRISFIAPSKSLADNWLKAYPEFRERITVVPHQNCVGEYCGNMEHIPDSEPLRIAYVGYQAPHKGWNEWADAVEQAFRAGKNYKFFHMGVCSESRSYIQQINVDFHSDINGMTKALRDNRIDCAVLWSMVPETYSFTLYEAYSANCFILTNPLSGNIAYVVRDKGNGIVAESSNDLSELLLDEEGLRKRINQFRDNKEYGPYLLEENDAIVDILAGDKSASKTTVECFSLADRLMKLFLCAYTPLEKLRRRKNQ